MNVEGRDDTVDLNERVDKRLSLSLHRSDGRALTNVIVELDGTRLDPIGIRRNRIGLKTTVGYGEGEKSRLTPMPSEM